MSRRQVPRQLVPRLALPVAALSVASLVLASLVLASLVPAWTPPAVAAQEARGIDRVCPAPSSADADSSPSDPFPDAGATHGAAIQCASDYGLVSGFPDGTFGPAAPLTRGQMATVLRRLIETATNAALPVPAADAFPDVAGSAHREAIAALEAVGVVAGRADGRFDPGGTVTRGQMARFIVNALDRIDDPGIAGSFPPPDATVRFDDVPGTTFEAEIGALAAQGVALGTSATSYRPRASVSRGQLATFLMRAADLLAAEGAWQPVAVDPESPPVPVELTMTDGAVVAATDGTGTLATGQGQPGASATAFLVLDPVAGAVSFAVEYGEVQGPFDASAGVRLQRGAPGTNGPTVLVLATGPQLEAGSDQRLGGVVQVTDTAGNDVAAAIRQVLADPAGHYLTIRSNDYSWGAVRGQLPVPG